MNVSWSDDKEADGDGESDTAKCNALFLLSIYFIEFSVFFVIFYLNNCYV